MGKIEKLLDKTKRDNAEPKKHKIYIFFLIALLVGGVLFLGLNVVSEPIIKKHYNTLDVAILYDFLEDEAKSDESAVIVIGNSMTGYSTYAPLIDEILMSRGYDTPTYNCYIDGTNSLMTALQIDSIIKAHPALVVYGVSYNTFPKDRNNALTEEKILFSKDKFTLSDDFKQYYTDDELDLLEKHPFELRGYLGRVIFPTNTRTGNYDTKEPIGVERRLNHDKEKDLENTLNMANGFRNVDFTNASKRSKDVFSHSVQKLHENGIKVLVINMPLHPLASENVPLKERENLLNFIRSTNATVVDMQDAFPDDSHFFDAIHTSWSGAQESSAALANLIMQELS